MLCDLPGETTSNPSINTGHAPVKGAIKGPELHSLQQSSYIKPAFSIPMSLKAYPALAGTGIDAERASTCGWVEDQLSINVADNKLTMGEVPAVESSPDTVPGNRDIALQAGLALFPQSFYSM